jgi:hypothetical protein
LRLTIHAQHASLPLHDVFFLRTIHGAPMFCARTGTE